MLVYKINKKDSKNKYDKDWDWYADLIDNRKESEEWKIIRIIRESHWEELCKIKKGDKVLDAGCGHGDYTKLLLLKGAKVWAFDSSRNMVLATQKRLERLGLKVEELIIASVLSIPYPDEMFDAVLCLAVIDHIPDSERIIAVKELARVLRPGGDLYINTPNKYAYHWRLGHFLMRLLGKFPKGKIHWFTPKELKKIICSTGLIPKDSLGLELLPPFSGIYTSDLKRYTFFPEKVISLLDKLYLNLEIRLRRIRFLQSICLHYFLIAKKPLFP